MIKYKMNVKILKQHEMVLGGLFVFFILFDIPIPNLLAEGINSITGNIIVLVCALYLFVHVHPAVGILGLYTAYELIHRSNPGLSPIPNNTTLETRKDFDKLAANQFPVTLEEEVVKQRVPEVNTSTHTSGASYKPVLEDSYQSAFI
jgi:hypothetical protein